MATAASYSIASSSSSSSAAAAPPAGLASPSKRPRSPNSSLATYASSKLIHSPSTSKSQDRYADFEDPATSNITTVTGSGGEQPFLNMQADPASASAAAILQGGANGGANGMAGGNISINYTAGAPPPSSNKTFSVAPSVAAAAAPAATSASSSAAPSPNLSPTTVSHPHASSHQSYHQHTQAHTHAPSRFAPLQSSSSTSDHRLPSHSGSTTSGFSAGSAGSSYDGGSGVFSAYDDPHSHGAPYGIMQPQQQLQPASHGGHGLGVQVQGSAYGIAPASYASAPVASSSASSRQQQQQHLMSPTQQQGTIPASAHGYYSQPYGYQSPSAAMHQHHHPQPPSAIQHMHGAYGTSAAGYHTSPLSQQAFPASVPSSSHPNPASSGPFPTFAQHQHHRRSIAGLSTGSSYHSGASASPTGHRRSDDMMDTAFMPPSSSSTISGPSSSLSSMPYSTPTTDAGSPRKQNWSPSHSGPHSTSAHLQHGAMSATSPLVAGFVDLSRPPGAFTSGPAAAGSAAVGGPPGQHGQPANPQNYQNIVDEIMNQTRKGTDYGLDLGDFEMFDTLGTGTFGRVLLVRLNAKASAVAGLNTGTPHYFAMKVLAKSEVVRLKQVEHINCERSILGAVDHSGIVNLFCTFQDSLNIYMLLEFVQGGELFSHLRRAVRFSADVTRFYAANIILVLEYLHNRNLIYRDLKPENLLLDSQGYLKVTDFGFAKYVPDRTFTLCGTPEYLAPEIINSAGHGKAADWWAFGVLLFEMLCGYPPFFDESPWGIYEKILAGTFSFPPHVDPVARDLIRRLLSSDRSKRLGNLRGGGIDVKNHQWFEGVDWSAVERRLIPAPIVPRIKSTSDSQNFERYPSIPIETLPGLAKAKGIPVKEEADPYEHMFVHF